MKNLKNLAQQKQQQVQPNYLYSQKQPYPYESED
jgi:hypothetical protein